MRNVKINYVTADAFKSHWVDDEGEGGEWGDT